MGVFIEWYNDKEKIYSDYNYDNNVDNINNDNYDYENDCFIGD